MLLITIHQAPLHGSATADTLASPSLDVDECIAVTDNCFANAACTHIYDAFIGACVTGYPRICDVSCIKDEKSTN